MNPFFDISNEKDLPSIALQLFNLGNQKLYATVGRRTREGWGESRNVSGHHYTAVVPQDYDNQFIHKMIRWKPIYAIDNLLDHHYEHYIKTHTEGKDEFLKHIRYIILPDLEKRKNSEVCVTLLMEWLNKNEIKTFPTKMTKVVNNNTINVGNINSPTQFLQNSSNSTLTQHNQVAQKNYTEMFDLLRKDIQNIDEKIRQDFAMEMEYAVSQIERGRDIQPQLSNLGKLIKEVGIGTFTNLAASPLYEYIKPHIHF